MGSGEAPKPKRGRARNGGLDLVSMAPSEVGTQPSFARGQVVEQDEFVAVLNASTTFQVTTFVLQPGLAGNFPWLSAIASLYQKYRILSWEFYYKPIVSEFDPIGQRGKVIMSFDSDVVGQYLTTFQQAEGMQPHVDFMPYQKARLPLSGRLYSNTNSGLFVRSAAPPAGTDPKTYDAGILYVSTQGMSGSGSMGELHVRYRVELINPVLPNVQSQPLNFKLTSLYQNTIACISATYIQAANLLVGPSGNGLQLPVASGVVTMPSGIFRINYSAGYALAGGLASVVAVQVRINGAGVRGSTALVAANAGIFNPMDLNGSFCKQFTGGELLTIWVNGTFAAGTCTADVGLEISTI